MNGAFPDAAVTGYEALITDMTNDPKDRHVLASAVRGGAEVLVTENLRDFPPAAVRSYGIQVVSQDAYLLDQLDLRPADVLDALRRQASRYHREPRNVAPLLTILGGPASGCPDFAQACRQAQDHPQRTANMLAVEVDGYGVRVVTRRYLAGQPGMPGSGQDNPYLAILLVEAVPDPAAAGHLDLPLLQLLTANLPCREVGAELMMAFRFRRPWV